MATKVKILHCKKHPYLEGMIGRIKDIEDDIYSILVGPTMLELTEKDFEYIK